MGPMPQQVPDEYRIPFVSLYLAGALKGILQIFLLGDENQVHHVALAPLGVEDTWRQIIYHRAELEEPSRERGNPAARTSVAPSIGRSHASDILHYEALGIDPHPQVEAASARMDTGHLCAAAEVRAQ